MMGTAEKDEERRTTRQHIRCARRGRAERWDVHPMREGWQAQQNKITGNRENQRTMQRLVNPPPLGASTRTRQCSAGSDCHGNGSGSRRVGIFHPIERLHLYLCSIYASLVPNA
eukprot:GHVU01176023.1.p8 GENE.GHVU01176023.1~~GHVU01176023.1.p8  ORF type:complete len:114 (-),score=10.49 GHVU01176023.1:446-787(-)